jgi:hypothetical protein
VSVENSNYFFGGLLMDNNSQNDELRVDHYDAEAAAEKKRTILKRVGIGAGIAAILAILAYFGLNVLQDILVIEPGPIVEQDVPMTEHVVGGNGAWFNSEVVFLGDKNG